MDHGGTKLPIIMASTACALKASIPSPGLLPAFLCPALLRPHLCAYPKGAGQTSIQKRQHHVVSESTSTLDQSWIASPLLALPLQCPGCGAYTQPDQPQKAGYYSITRKAVKDYLAHLRESPVAGHGDESDAFAEITKNAGPELLEALGLTPKTPSTQSTDLKEDVATPVCNRCHDLLHHHTGVSIDHPDLISIQHVISESPYKYNHIYHVLDAADFPLSLLPRLQHHLSLTPQRSYNRRSEKSTYRHGRKAEMSFIITRSDLLAPKKEQVDSLMPYLIQVLREALGSSGRYVRLGNVRCVSSKRGWWTKTMKEEVWERGGGGWMVGKANVGKSNLLECIFPKGRTQDINFRGLQRKAFQGANIHTTTEEAQQLGMLIAPKKESPSDSGSRRLLEEGMTKVFLLPPAPQEKQYPVMPVVSSLPGTTASPIRLSFGGGKGELIDLPGLAREGLEEYVSEEYRSEVVMRQRVKPEKFSIKPGQSLLLGGIIRITPITPDTIFLAYPFLPLSGHVTSTEKAVAIQTQQKPSGIASVAKPGVGRLIASAGLFRVQHDVTKQRAGPLTARAAVGLKAHRLSFVVYSTDILVEGCGWVELVVQVRRREIGPHTEDGEGTRDEPPSPEIEVFSPNGRYIGSRRPMNGWLLGGDKPVSARQKTARPRRSMKGDKKNRRVSVRAVQGT